MSLDVIYLSTSVVLIGFFRIFSDLYLLDFVILLFLRFRLSAARAETRCVDFGNASVNESIADCIACQQANKTVS